MRPALWSRYKDEGETCAVILVLRWRERLAFHSGSTVNIYIGPIRTEHFKRDEKEYGELITYTSISTHTYIYDIIWLSPYTPLHARQNQHRKVGEKPTTQQNMSTTLNFLHRVHIWGRNKYEWQMYTTMIIWGSTTFNRGPSIMQNTFLANCGRLITP